MASSDQLPSQEAMPASHAATTANVTGRNDYQQPFTQSGVAPYVDFELFENSLDKAGECEHKIFHVRNNQGNAIPSVVSRKMCDSMMDAAQGPYNTTYTAAHVAESQGGVRPHQVPSQTHSHFYGQTAAVFSPHNVSPVLERACYSQMAAQGQHAYHNPYYKEISSNPTGCSSTHACGSSPQVDHYNNFQHYHSPQGSGQTRFQEYQPTQLPLPQSTDVPSTFRMHCSPAHIPLPQDYAMPLQTGIYLEPYHDTSPGLSASPQVGQFRDREMPTSACGCSTPHHGTSPGLSASPQVGQFRERREMPTSACGGSTPLYGTSPGLSAQFRQREMPNSACEGRTSDSMHQSGTKSTDPDAAAHSKPSPLRPLRTPNICLQDHAVKDAHSRAVELGVPCGPIPLMGGDDDLEDDRLKSKVLPCAVNSHTGGGGHGLNFCRPQVANTKRGRRVTFGCNKRRNKSVNCGWELEYELTTEGWFLSRAVSKHSHNLCLHSSEVMTRASGRFIPVQLISIGEAMAAANKPTAMIHDVLFANAKLQSLDITWDKEDIRQRFANAAQNEFDMADMVDYLGARRHRTGCKYFCQLKDNGEPRRIWVELNNAFTEWACTDDNVLLFDPTWGTNRYGMKLCCFTTVAPTGQTVILAFAILASECNDDIFWAFRCFSEIFKKDPASIWTDDAGAICLAIEKMKEVGLWQNTYHFLCIYHLSKNFFKHVKPHFPDVEKWHYVNSWFWVFAKCSEEDFPIQSEWLAFITYVEQHGAGEKLPDCIKWLNSLFGRREQWMAHYTWNVVTWGIHSTQRAESIHSAIKSERSLANSKLVVLTDALLQYNVKSRDTRSLDSARLAMRQLSANSTVSPLIAAWRTRLTPAAYEILLAQAEQALQYTATIIHHDDQEDGDMSTHVAQPVDDDVWRVTYNGSMSARPSPFSLVLNADGKVSTWQSNEDFGLGVTDFKRAGHLTSKIACSCKFPCSFRLPCRHLIYIYIVEQEANLPVELFGSKWLVSVDAVKTQAQVTELRKQLPPKLNRSVSVHVPTYTKDQRYDIVSDELRAVIELAAESNGSMEALLASLPALCNAVRKKLVIRDNTENAELSSAEGSPGTSAGVVKVATATPDESSLINAMGSTWLAETITEQTIDDPKKMIGRHIVYKWSKSGAGGFYVGKICREAEDTHFNYTTTFSDGSYDVLLSFSSLLSRTERTFHMHDWALLKEKPLGDVVEGNPDLRNPALVAKIGRKRTRRGAPAYGPTSRSK